MPDPTPTTAPQSTDNEPVDLIAALERGEGPEGNTPPGSPDAEGADKAAAVEETDPYAQELDFDGEKVTVGELKELYTGLNSLLDAKQRLTKREASLNAIVEGLRSSPRKVIEDLFSNLHGEDGIEILINEVVVPLINDYMADESAPAEAKEAKKWRLEAEKAKAEADRLRRAQADEAHTAETRRHMTVLQREITEAAKAAGLSGTDRDIEEISGYMLRAEESGLKPNAARAVARVIKDRAAARANVLTEDTKIEEIPAALLKRIREHDITQVRSKQGAQATTAQSTVDEEPKAQKPRLRVLI